MVGTLSALGPPDSCNSLNGLYIKNLATLATSFRNNQFCDRLTCHLREVGCTLPAAARGQHRKNMSR
jgi:hypothetical protein